MRPIFPNWTLNVDGSYSYGTQFKIGNTSNAVNYVIVNGGASGSPAGISAEGVDANIGITYTIKGTGQHSFIGQVAISSTLTVNGGSGLIISNGNCIISAAGKGVTIKGGANSRIGTAVLVAGTVTVANNTVTANTIIMAMCKTPGGVTGFIGESARVNGTSFTITSSNVADTSTIQWILTEQT